MPTIDFDAARAERRRERDPLAFVLGGEHFTCLPVIPVGAGLDLADAPERSDQTGAHVRGLIAFIKNTLVDDDLDRFDKVLRAKTDPVGADDLFDVAVALSQEYTGRPTSPSTDSSGGRDSTGETSSSEHFETSEEVSAT